MNTAETKIAKMLVQMAEVRATQLAREPERIFDAIAELQAIVVELLVTSLAQIGTEPGSDDPTEQNMKVDPISFIASVLARLSPNHNPLMYLSITQVIDSDTVALRHGELKTDDSRVTITTFADALNILQVVNLFQWRSALARIGAHLKDSGDPQLAILSTLILDGLETENMFSAEGLLRQAINTSHGGGNDAGPHLIAVLLLLLKHRNIETNKVFNQKDFLYLVSESFNKVPKLMTAVPSWQLHVLDSMMTVGINPYQIEAGQPESSQIMLNNLAHDLSSLLLKKEANAFDAYQNAVSKSWVDRANNPYCTLLGTIMKVIKTEDGDKKNAFALVSAVIKSEKNPNPETILQQISLDLLADNTLNQVNLAKRVTNKSISKKISEMSDASFHKAISLAILPMKLYDAYLRSQGYMQPRNKKPGCPVLHVHNEVATSGVVTWKKETVKFFQQIS